MRTLPAIALLSACVLFTACGDNFAPAIIVDGSVIDVPDLDVPDVDAAVDAAVDADIDADVDANCPSRAPGQIGGPCTTDAMCDSAAGAGDGSCLRGAVGPVTWPAEGYCVNKIDTCFTDNQCGTGNQCVTINGPGGTSRACLPSCGTGSCVCSNGQICASSFSGSTLANNDFACLPGNASATDGDPCGGFGECPQDSVCLQDPLEYPGGQCHRFGCTVGNDSTCAAGGDGHCIDNRTVTAGFDNANLCIDTCTTDVDCRQADGYKCIDGGAGVGRFCRHPQAGDACTTDADCGDPALWDCKIGLTFPGGMCTPTTGCPTPGSHVGCSPASSICYDSVLPGVASDNVCVDRCGGPQNTQGGCRTGYVCRDTDTSPGTTTLGCVNP